MLILAREAPYLTRNSGMRLATKTPAVLAGDYNVIPTDLDVYKPERWLDDALFRPEVREAFARLVALGWTDAVRELHPNEPHLYFLGLLPKCLDA